MNEKFTTGEQKNNSEEKSEKLTNLEVEDIFYQALAETADQRKVIPGYENANVIIKIDTSDSATLLSEVNISGLNSLLDNLKEKGFKLKKTEYDDFGLESKLEFDA